MVSVPNGSSAQEIRTVEDATDIDSSTSRGAAGETIDEVETSAADRDQRLSVPTDMTREGWKPEAEREAQEWFRERRPGGRSRP